MTHEVSHPERSESNKVRMGIVGFGGSGSRHALAFSNLPGVRVTAIVDPIVRERAFAESLGARFYETDTEFLEDGNYDALFVATPDAPEPLDEIKVEWARLMMNYPPVDTLWERPIGLDEDEWSTITGSARSSKFAANYFWRFGVYRNVLSALNSEDISLGDVRSLRIVSALNDGLDHKFWRFNRKVQLPLIFLDHAFDLVSYLGLPKIHAVRAHRRDGPLGGKPIDVAWEIDVELANGARGFISASQYYGPTEHFRPFSVFDVQGDRGWLRINENGAHFLSSEGDSAEIVPQPLDATAAATNAVREFIVSSQGVPATSAASESTSLTEHAWHFVRWIRNEGEQYPLATADDALHALRIGMSVIQSAESDRWVVTT